MKLLSRILAVFWTCMWLFTAVSCGQSEEQSTGKTSQAAKSATTVSGDELATWIHAKKEMLILDSRTPAEYNSGHIPGAVNIPHTQVARRLDELKAYRDLPVVSYCERGPRAYSAERALREAGFTQVLHLEGDMSDWRRKKRPTDR